MKKADHHLVMSAFDGSLAPREFQELQRRLTEEPEFLQLYRDHALLNHALAEEFEGENVPAAESPKNRERSGGRAARWGLLGAAAAVLVAVTGLFWWQRQQVETGGTATLVMASGSTAFVNDHAPGRESVLEAGAQLRVSDGWAQLNFSDGSTAIFEGPAKVRYVGGRILEMDEGKGRFHTGKEKTPLEVRCRHFTAVDRGTEFAVRAPAAGDGELHVFEGKVELRAEGREEHLVLQAGEAVKIHPRGEVDWIEANSEAFVGFLPERRELLSDRFEGGGELTGRLVAGGSAMWRVIDGHAVVTDDHLEGENFQAFCRLPEVFPTERYPILLVTMEAGGDDRFHTEGWAGLSLYVNKKEVCFFGDSFGRGNSWSLDVKQEMAPVYPSQERPGARTVCLRYDRRTGFVELYDGADPVGTPFVRSILAPGQSFDEIRLGASEGAKLTVRSVHMRMTDMR